MATYKRIRDEVPQNTSIVPDNKCTEDVLPCHKLLLSINSYGDIYPCCRQILNMKIGNLKDSDIVDKLYHYNPEQNCRCSIGTLGNLDSISKFKHINIELAGPCNGGCLYCFQKQLHTFNRPIDIYKELNDLFSILKPESIMIFGGEVGVQVETLEMLESFSKLFAPHISVATNGNMPKIAENRLLEIADELELTFNGFSEQTVSAVSNISFFKQMSFVEKALNKVKLSVKFLANPINVLELPHFIDWALEQPFDHVIVDSTIVTPDDYACSGEWGSSIFSYAKDFFWRGVFQSMENNIKNIINEYRKEILGNNTALIISPEIREMLMMSDSYFESIGLSENLKAKNVSISTSAWKSLL